MFDTKRARGSAEALTPDRVEQRLIGLEGEIAQLRAEQLRLLRRADLMQLASTDGTRSLHEWTAGRLDVSPETARDLVAICHHALGAGSDAGTEGPSGTHILLTADLVTLASTNGEAGATVVGGPRVGVNALDEALCNGSVALDVTAEDGTVLGVGSTTEVIPPRVRRHVLARDHACTADACTSRYHLEVHHIQPRSEGGDHDPANLTTLCWFHHHRGGFGQASTPGNGRTSGAPAKGASTVVIHGKGYSIDPDTPPHRRRFTPPGTDPPQRE